MMDLEDREIEVVEEEEKDIEEMHENEIKFKSAMRIADINRVKV